jgi:hypothetical protein
MSVRRSSESSESVEDVGRWFHEQLSRLWPAALGSLTLRRSPCIRESCHACQTGEQHPSYVLYSRRNGRRLAVYVPDRFVPEVKKAVENGRALQDLLYEAGQRYARALKRETPASR